MKLKLELCKDTKSDGHSFYYISVNGEAKSDTVCHTPEDAERQFQYWRNVIIERKTPVKTEIIKSEKI